MTATLDTIDVRILEALQEPLAGIVGAVKTALESAAGAALVASGRAAAAPARPREATALAGGL